MIYDKRNRENLNKLADNTKILAYKWYEYCAKSNVNILIYETMRTEEKQREYVRQGKSQTMRSFHLTGQALDFVPVDNNGNCLWNGYDDVMNVIHYAKSLGFEWGGDWNSFPDKPHLQYRYKGYGTDTFTNKVDNNHYFDVSVDIDDLVQRTLRGEFGNGEERKRKLGIYYQTVQNIINNKSYHVDIDDLVKRTLRGEFGNGEERKRKLGIYYQDVQRRINMLYYK